MELISPKPVVGDLWCKSLRLWIWSVEGLAECKVCAKAQILVQISCHHSHNQLYWSNWEFLWSEKALHRNFSFELSRTTYMLLSSFANNHNLKQHRNGCPEAKYMSWKAKLQRENWKTFSLPPIDSSGTFPNAAKNKWYPEAVIAKTITTRRTKIVVPIERLMISEFSKIKLYVRRRFTSFAVRLRVRSFIGLTSITFIATGGETLKTLPINSSIFSRWKFTSFTWKMNFNIVVLRQTRGRKLITTRMNSRFLP